MTITGQDYDELTDIRVEHKLVAMTIVGTTIYFDPEGAIKVAHALIEAAEEIIKK